MNGYELADEIKTMLADAESYYGEAESYLIKCETMLRQQQAEIADKKLVNDTFADLIKKQGKKIEEQQIEIEALKAKAHEWYLIAMEKAQE